MADSKKRFLRWFGKVDSDMIDRNRNAAYRAIVQVFHRLLLRVLYLEGLWDALEGFSKSFELSSTSDSPATPNLVT